MEEIKKSIAARQRARDVVELVGDECPRFWEELRDLAAARLGKPTGDEPMTDAECDAFEARVMKFGKHQGSLVGDVPLEYLDWLVGAREDDRFLPDLVRYLKSMRVYRYRAANSI